jgi:hypothetical protein
LENAKTNKKLKWKNNRSRIIDALMSNAHDDQYESMLENLSMLTDQEFSSNKHRILLMALKNGSERCADFLLSKEAKANSNQIMTTCEYTKIVDIYNLLDKLILKYEDQFTRSLVNQKSYLIDRLIKEDAKSERVDFLFKLISDGFFTPEEVRTQIEYNFKDKPEKKNKFISIYRELTLKELGI